MAGNPHPGHCGAGNPQPAPGTLPVWGNLGAGRAGTLAEAINQTPEQF